MNLKVKAAYDFLKLQMNNDGIWIARIDNPPMNLLSVNLLSDFENLLKLFKQDRKAKVLIVTGEGERAFSAGADINEIARIDSPAMGKKLAQKGHRVCNLIEQSNKPVIMAINGLCIGGGNEIAMSAHIRIAAENAKFSQPELNIGIIPGFGATQRLADLIGVSQATRLILTCDVLNAVEAYQLGLVDEVVKKDMALEQALAIGRRIIRNSPFGISLCMMAIRESLKAKKSKSLKFEIKCFHKICKTNDMKEGLQAFREKRLPNFKGN